MFLDVLPFKNDTARLVRVYGDEPCITLPEALPAPEGGTLTITELGDYCFSEKPRGLPAPEELCRYAVEPGRHRAPPAGLWTRPDGRFSCPV